MWKRWSYIKKGGIIGVVLGIIPFMLGLNFFLKLLLADSARVPALDRAFAAVLGVELAVAGIFLFLFCLLIGWIVEKVKSK